MRTATLIFAAMVLGAIAIGPLDAAGSADAPQPPGFEVTPLDELQPASTPSALVPGIDALWDAGAPATIAILDTGVKPTDALDGRVAEGYDYHPGVPPGDDVWRGSGHGTIAAELAAGDPPSGPAGACPYCDILSYRLYDGDFNAGSQEDFADAVRRAVADGADVISMSFAGNRGFAGPLLEEVRRAVDAGVLVVASAGNTGTDARQYPAADDHVVGVAGTRGGDAGWHTTLRQGLSSYGPWVDVAAPFCSVVHRPDPVRVCGTSGSAPLVAGAAAVLAGQYGDAVAAGEALVDTVDPELTWVGAGTIDVAAADSQLQCDVDEDCTRLGPAVQWTDPSTVEHLTN